MIEFVRCRTIPSPREQKAVMTSKILLIIICACSLSATLTACSGGSGSSSNLVGPSAKIKHIVVIFQENRTPDNLFHGLPGADIAESGINSRGERITLQPTNLGNT